MNEKIQNAMDWLASVDVNSEAEATCKELLLSTITELDKENNELHSLYRRTADHFLDIGREDLADYLYAKIGSTPTWEVRDSMDYYSEYYKLKDKYKEMSEKLKKIEMTHDLEIIGKKEETEAYMKEIIDEYYIPVEKIQDKIDEINKAYEDSKNEYGEPMYYYPGYTIDILEELLKDKGSEIEC